jgi:hypothetical protein
MVHRRIDGGNLIALAIPSQVLSKRNALLVMVGDGGRAEWEIIVGSRGQISFRSLGGKSHPSVARCRYD